MRKVGVVRSGPPGNDARQHLLEQVLYVEDDDDDWQARLMLAGGQRVLGKPVDCGELALTQLHLSRMGQRRG